MSGITNWCLSLCLKSINNKRTSVTVCLSSLHSLPWLSISLRTIPTVLEGQGGPVVSACSPGCATASFSFHFPPLRLPLYLSRHLAMVLLHQDLFLSLLWLGCCFPVKPHHSLPPPRLLRSHFTQTFCDCSTGRGRPWPV